MIGKSRRTGALPVFERGVHAANAVQNGEGHLETVTLGYGWTAPRDGRVRASCGADVRLRAAPERGW
jgi:hypothetical protein